MRLKSQLTVLVFATLLAACGGEQEPAAPAAELAPEAPLGMDAAPAEGEYPPLEGEQYPADQYPAPAQ